MKWRRSELGWMDVLSLGILAVFGGVGLWLLVFGSSLDMAMDVSRSLLPPGEKFFLGTDLLGKSIFLKSLFGVKNAILFGLIASV